ncbi:MAG TPA: zinc finger Ran-binding domain-containing protein [Nannocystaceae bacterium]|nr:zinc finger Ran-binding domain-containing protein [Nannocystaceae bacterium]
MANVSRIVMACVAALLLFVSGCKKSVEGETAAWDSNVAQVKELAAQYPGFKGALDARLAAAQKIRDAADGLGDEQKIAKLSEANTAIRKDFVSDLAGLDEKMKKLREARAEAAAKAGDESSRLGAKVAAEDAKGALDRADAALAKGASDEASAAAVVKKIASDIDAAQSAVDKVVKADKEKKDDKASDEKAKADADAKAKADAEAKVAPWKCEYCGHENKHDAGKCEQCGAPKADEKK